MKTKKVFRFATGEPIPESAVYLSTVVNGDMPIELGKPDNYKFVWHYFLCEVDDEAKTRGNKNN